LKKLLPSLDYTLAAPVNLDSGARRLFPRAGASFQNPLLEPSETQRLVDAIHREHHIEWSYGGYHEDRSFLLRGTYLDEVGGYLHMGIDCNAPAGTPIAAPFRSTVVDVFDDGPELQGWGPRIIIATDSVRAPYLLLGHLGPLQLSVGHRLEAGERIGEIGAPPGNGFWFPHLHLQIVSAAAFERLAAEDFRSLDGYGHPRDKVSLSADFPDPTWLVEDSLR